MEYRVDLRDLKFQLFDWLPTEELLGAGRYADWDREQIEMVVDEAAKIAREKLAPTNEDGDDEGARLENGRVTVPASFREAYATVAGGGWVGSTCSPEHGGMGLPHVAGTVVNELFSGANLSLSLVFLLTRGAGQLIEDHGTDEVRGLFCEKLYSGEWSGTMCLTEPHAGSDVGASTTSAVPLENGRYRIKGEKIFITFGDHDMTENIVHAVLARLPDAPAGTRGLSLFVVPRVRVEAGGGLGGANDVVCGSIEHKLGIHGSPTCSLLFGSADGCEGFLLGEPHNGMRIMFEMMNAARIEVGLQGMAVAGAAQQAALAYARERVQSRHWTARGAAPPVSILEHPDVRRMLWTSESYVQAMRALLLQTSYFLDKAHLAAGDEGARYQSYVDVLTPICKAWASDWSFRVTEWCLQVYGGYGYTRDYPAEQYLRDAKIGSIYEGTNGIQALDLVARKMPAAGGRPFRELLGMAAATAGRFAEDPLLGPPAALLGRALEEIGELAAAVQERPDGPLMMMLNAVPFLDLTGAALSAHLLLEQAGVAQARRAEILRAKGVDAADREAYQALLAADRDAAFYHNKILAASHFAYRALPAATAAGVALRAGETAPIDAVM
ncbi:MAG: acyl-CoA dehydrogenase [Acidobacteriota bacterium]|nr:acyl-CoA dehydrogenase [Acidobacteriota bacterium]MDH3525130.1 acyl-CoA dehydrogenase [Acidobacteriota bacterium]